MDRLFGTEKICVSELIEIVRGYRVYQIYARNLDQDKKKFSNSVNWIALMKLRRHKTCSRWCPFSKNEILGVSHKCVGVEKIKINAGTDALVSKLVESMKVILCKVIF